MSVDPQILLAKVCIDNDIFTNKRKVLDSKTKNTFRLIRRPPLPVAFPSYFLVALPTNMKKQPTFIYRLPMCFGYREKVSCFNNDVANMSIELNNS